MKGQISIELNFFLLKIIDCIIYRYFSSLKTDFCSFKIKSTTGVMFLVYIRQKLVQIFLFIFKLKITAGVIRYQPRQPFCGLNMSKYLFTNKILY